MFRVMGSLIPPRSSVERRPQPVRLMRGRLEPGWRPTAKPSGLRLIAPDFKCRDLHSAGLRRGPALLALLLILPTRAADHLPGMAATDAPAHALIQLAGQPLSGGRSRGSVSLPLERAEGGHTPVLDFQVSGLETAAGSGADAAIPGHARRQNRLPRPGPRIRLLLDTGATSTMVTPELADRLALVRRPLPPGSFGLAGGGEGCADLTPQRTRLPDLVLHGSADAPDALALHLEGVEALVLPVAALPAGVDGVLGVPSLRLLPIRIDPTLGRIALGAAALNQLPFPLSPSSRATPPARSFAPLNPQPISELIPWPSSSATSATSLATGSATSSVNPSVPSGSSFQRVPLSWHRGVPLLQLASGSGAVQALADTGAEGLFLQPALAARLRPLGPAQPLRLVGFCGEQRVERRRFAGLGLGQGTGGAASTAGSPSPWDVPAEVDGIVTDNPIFEQLGVEAIVGQEILQHRRQLWRLDQPRPELLLW